MRHLVAEAVGGRHVHCCGSGEKGLFHLSSEEPNLDGILPDSRFRFALDYNDVGGLRIGEAKPFPNFFFQGPLEIAPIRQIVSCERFHFPHSMILAEERETRMHARVQPDFVRMRFLAQK